MNIPGNLSRLAGQWTGSSHLWLTPDDPVRSSASNAVVSLIAQGKFLTLHYQWEYEGKPQDGLLLVGFNPQQGVENSAWVDSWHMNDQMLLSKGDFTADGVLKLRGAYPAPPDPDWGWWIEIDPQDGSTFKLLMYNVTPQGQAFLAVEASYTRI